MENLAMKGILITGHLGYVGAALLPALRATFPNAVLAGLDTGFFRNDTFTDDALPEECLDQEFSQDIRDISNFDLSQTDAIVHLAAVSNDPIGKNFEDATAQINLDATIRLAKAAKVAGVRRFIFASSCSIYGATNNEIIDEDGEKNPQTAYARSKVQAEKVLAEMADPDFQVTCLRFGTACGFSKRLRLDLVVNDFVAMAAATNNIELLSAGTAWRPFIHVSDMARAIIWGLERTEKPVEIVNVGSDTMCFSIRHLASEVRAQFEGSTITIASTAVPDTRSYRVSFKRFAALAPQHQPVWNPRKTVEDLKTQLLHFGLVDPNFRTGSHIRLNRLTELQAAGSIDRLLKWRKA